MDSQTNLPVSLEALANGKRLHAKRRASPDVMAKFETALLDNSKSGWSRLGAFDPEERSHCLELFGFQLQLVLGIYAYHQVAPCEDRDTSFC